jgi:hypothetical protein
VFNFEEFIKDLQVKFGDELSYDTISDLVDLDGIYQKDSPNSLGKRLVLNALKINGQKVTGETINYTKSFYSGVNVLFADNGKGKSSVFKIIKFALTGDKTSIKKDVITWLHEIYLEFYIGNVTYTTYIDLTGKRTSSALYRLSMDKVINIKQNKNPIEDHLIQFEARSDISFQENMQEFFYKEFSYYSLKWTSSNKTTVDLIENQTSWKTYYKSIYLESKDYNVLFLNQDFGTQGRKILEMFLGLQLTSAINTLNLKRDYLDNTLVKNKFVKNIYVKPEKEDVYLNELNQVNQAIDDIKLNQKITFQKSHNLKVYNNLTNEIKRIENELLIANTENQEVNKQITQLTKQFTRLEEELNFGMFFSNLEVKVCPRCEHNVEPDKMTIEQNEHKCMLCESELSDANEEDKNALEFKIEELKQEVEKLQDVYQIGLKRLRVMEKDKEEHMSKLVEIESNINSFNFFENDIDLLSSNIQRKLELEFLIEQSGNEIEEDTHEKIEIKIDLLNYAMEYLNSHRLDMGQSILISFRKLILDQMHKFGLVSVTDVIITDKLDIQFLQNNELNKFNELNEGEQLRAKIAFYISLILLDIEFSVGRHPRLLIIDSPGKEEVISQDLIGLSSIFNDIESSFSESLQIIIGTALEPLKNASIEKKVDCKNPGETVF